MHTTTERCQKCNGHGDIPSGYDRFGSGLMAWRQCPVCDGRGVVEVEPEPEPTPPAAALSVGGFTVDAPGFTVDTFDRAIHRAHNDGLQVAPTDRADCVLVSNPLNGASYTTSRRDCSCTAGRRGLGCKHRALAIFLADIMHALPTPAPQPVAA